MFRSCVVFVRSSSIISSSLRNNTSESGDRDILLRDLRMYGAQIVEKPCSKTTHVIFLSLPEYDLLDFLKSINRENDVQVKCVRHEWVTDSITNGSLLDEKSYRVAAKL